MHFTNLINCHLKVEKILKGSLDSIPSPSRSREQLIFFLNFFFGQTLLGVVNPIPNRLGHVIYNERADSALTW